MKKFALLAALFVAAFANVAQAQTITIDPSAAIVLWGSDGKINITGAVSDSTCKINGTAQNGTSVTSLSIALGTVSKADFVVAGKTGSVATGTTSSGYNVALTACPVSSTVSLMLDGIGAIDTATSSYKNTTSGGAANINAQIVNAENGLNTLLDPRGANKITKTTDIAGNANFLLGARFVATGAATAGGFTTTAGFTVVYN